jgi:hypothetical protein
VYWRAKGYFQLSSQLIEKSLQYISDEELKHSNYSNYRQLNEIDNNENIKKLSIFNNKIVNKKDKGLRELDDGCSIGQYGYDSNNSSDEVNDPIIASNNYKNETSSIIDPEFYNEAISDEPPINSVFCFNVMDTLIFNTNFSELEYFIEFKINSLMTADICINLKALINKGESLVIGTDGSANVSFTGECNLYIPSQKVENYIWVKVGLDGVLGGTIGMNLNLYLKGEYKDMYSLDCYNIINSYELRDYVISQVEFGNINSTNFANPYKNETTKETEIYYGIKQYYQINTNEKVEDQCIETTRIYISGTINETITKCE